MQGSNYAAIGPKDAALLLKESTGITTRNAAQLREAYETKACFVELFIPVMQPRRRDRLRPVQSDPKGLRYRYFSPQLTHAALDAPKPV